MTTLVPSARTPTFLSTYRSRVSPDYIYSTYTTRRNKQAKTIAAGMQIRKVYNGEWETDLLDARERTQVANLIQSGLDGHAQRIASVMPNVMFPPERNSRAARARANERKQVMYAWHEMNKMPLLFRERARYLAGYGTSPIYIRPGTDGVPAWDVWDPLATFPAPGPQRDMVPLDVIYRFERTWGWLDKTYGIRNRLPLGDGDSHDAMVECLMYCDEYEHTMIAVGQDDGGSTPTLLQSVPNLARRPTVIVPRRITLDRLQGQFDQMIGPYESQGLLWAMHLEAMKRAIFTEVWLQGSENSNPQIITPADPIRGIVGEVSGGTLNAFRSDPSVQTGQTLDRIERAMRQDGGIPSEMGGESGSNIRTARRGSQVLSSAIDFPIQEHQDILASSLEEEDKAAIAVARGYWGDTERTLYVAFGDGQVTYTPNTTFPNDTHRVKYAFSGSDAETLRIQILQSVGAGTASEDLAMELDPLIDDPIYEKGRIVAGQIEKAILSSIQTQAADPASPYSPADLSYLLRLIRDEKKELTVAIDLLQQKKQDEQAATQGPTPPTGPAAQPGLAMPGAPGTPQAGVPDPNAPTIGPTPDQAGLGQLMNTLRHANNPIR